MSQQGIVCSYNKNHVDPQICIYKECKNDRIACVKCINDIHNHQITEPYYLNFENFMKHIDKLLDVKSKKYQFYEKIISKLESQQLPCQLVYQCLSLLNKAQVKHIQSFQIWENRLIKDKIILNQMIQIDDNSQIKDYQKIQELLLQIKQSGIQIEYEQEQQQQEQQVQLYFQKLKCFEINYNFDGINGTAISPNGKYLSFFDKRQLQIFEIKKNKCIVNRKIQFLMNTGFTNDSQYYFYYNMFKINFLQLKTNKKQILRFNNNNFNQIDLFLFPQNLNEIMTNDYYLTIMNFQNRQKKTIQIDSDPRCRVDYDAKKDVIVCGDRNKQILFVNKTSFSVLFKHYQYRNLNNLKFIDNSNYLITGDTNTVSIYIVDYEIKQLYQIKQFRSDQKLWFYKIWDYNGILVLTNQGIKILNLDFNIYQNIEFEEEKDLIQIFNPQSQDHFIICTQEQMCFYRKQIQIIKGQN